MLVNGVEVLTHEEVRTMPDAEFRDAWIRVVNSLYHDEGSVAYHG